MRRSTTLRAILNRAVIGATLAMAVTSGLLLVAASHHNLPVRNDVHATGIIIQGLLAEYGCWRTNAPEGVIPGHVVITLSGADHATLGGQRLTAAALDQLFSDGPSVGTIHGFCR